MNRQDISKRQFAIYIAATFALGWIIEIIAGIFANHGNRAVFQLLMVILMYAPFAGVLISKISLKNMGWVPHIKGKIRYFFFALWMPAVLSIIGGVIYFLIFPKELDTGFLTVRSILQETGALEQFESSGMTIPMYLLITSVQAVTFAPFLNMLVALGEEIGWRGALYPYLKEKLGITKGRIAGGLIWGSWHWPVMLIAGYEYGKVYIGAPILGLIVFCISTVMMGILLDYVYEKTQTIWMPALMHGAINAFTVFVYLQKPEFAHKSILGPSLVGIISMIPMIVTAIIICKKQDSCKG